MKGLVLSLFPGIGLLDLAFEEAGFTVVRGPDVIWGGDVRRFNVPAGRFDGVIGGPPCQAFSTLRHMVEANGFQTSPNLIPEYERVVEQAQPAWFLMENVPAAPLPTVPGYQVHAQILCDHWVGGQTKRERRFSFGNRAGDKLIVDTLALHKIDVEPAVTCDRRRRPVAIGGSGKPKAKVDSTTEGAGPQTIERMMELQGLPQDFFGDHHAFTQNARKKMVGNGVPLPMGRAVANAVARVLDRVACAA